MPLRLVRNDITKMATQAIVNTANRFVLVGPGCDSAVYHAAGYDRLLDYRKTNIGEVEEGKAFLSPGFPLKPSSFMILFMRLRLIVLPISSDMILVMGRYPMA